MTGRLEMTPPRRPLCDRRLASRVAPFAVAVTVCVAAPLLVNWRTLRSEVVGVPLLIAVLTGLLTLTVPWRLLPPFAELLPLLGYLGAVVMLAGIAGDGVVGDVEYGALLMIPLFWLALYHAKREFIAGSVAVMISTGVVAFHSDRATSPCLDLIYTSTAAGVLATVIHLLSTQSEAQAAALRRLARTDPLTGIPNRRAFVDELERTLALSRRSGQPVSVALVDLDHFKECNDSRGHAAGDALLREHAATWQPYLRDTDIMARFGGDEFALLLPGCDDVEAQATVERLCRLKVGGRTCSVGLASWDGHEDLDALLSRADAALYEAKRSGRARTLLAPAISRVPALVAGV